MYIVTVIPISRGISKEVLTYFTRKEILRGSLVSVPLRKKIVPALVIKSEDASRLKSSLRQSDFSLKKIKEIKSRHFLTTPFMEVIHKSAEYFRATPGAVLSSLVPHVFFTSTTELISSSCPSEKELTASPFLTEDIYALQTQKEQRLSQYKSIIRESFAREKSVFVTVPTTHSADFVSKRLEKGIHQYIYTFHSGLSKKAFIKKYNSLCKESHPVLIIATAGFYALPRNDIGTVILEEERNESYTKQARPFLDLRFVSEQFARSIGARLILGDLLLRLETLYRVRKNEISEWTPLQFRTPTHANQHFINMTKQDEHTKKGFTLLSPDILNLIKITRTNNERMFIFAGRRGLFPTTVCGDCGHTLMCNHCTSPLVLHKQQNQEQNIFICHSCGEEYNATTVCNHCGSWKLNTLGIGIDRIEEEIQTHFPDLTIIRVDKDTTKTPSKAKKAVEEFYTKPGSVLLGTHMSLSYLHTPVEHTAVSSIDNLFTIPDFRIREKICALLLYIRSQAEKTFLLQTRVPEEILFQYIHDGTIIDFYRDEIEDRKALKYPPFSLLIKISLKGNRSYTEDSMYTLQRELAEYDFTVFPAFTATKKGSYVMNGIMKVSPDNWPDERLVKKLQNLPPQFTINVDPESVL